jgi:hypothetical protein
MLCVHTQLAAAKRGDSQAAAAAALVPPRKRLGQRAPSVARDPDRKPTVLCAPLIAARHAVLYLTEVTSAQELRLLRGSVPDRVARHKRGNKRRVEKH